MLIFSLLALASSKLCPIYQCSGSFQNISSSQCIEKVGFTYSLGTCSEEYYTYCPPNESDSFCQLPITVSDINISYIGEPCTFDRNCLNSLCTYKTCSGFNMNSTCSYTSQCNVGLYCLNNTCQSQRSQNEACESDYDCANNLGCFNSICLPYFSFGDGIVVKNCQSGINYLCSSGACGMLLNGSYACIGSNVGLSTPSPVMCLNDGDCLLSQGFAKGYSTGCQCGYNEFGISYCGLAPADNDFVNFIGLVKQWVNGTEIMNCHTYARTDLKCVNQQANYSFATNFTYRYLLVNNYSQVQDNDDCVKEIFTSQFWNAKNEYDNLPGKHKESAAFFFQVGLVLLNIF